METNDEVLRAGDRVRFSGRDHPSVPLAGTLGLVIAVESGTVSAAVQWDNGMNTVHDADELELIRDESSL